MSIGKRLLNVARAELRSAAKKVRASAKGERHEEELIDDEPAERAHTAPRKKSESARLHKYYANLELPLDASAAEVKAAYRRLMRRYHPDLHHGDAQKAKVATQLAQELRVAYEALLAHLEK